MTVRSTRLGDIGVATTGGGGATTTLFTVATDRTAILKDLRVWLASGSPPIDVDFFVLKANGSTRFVARYSRSALLGPMARRVDNGTDPDDLWTLLLEGDALRFSQPASCEVQVYASGALLAGDPS